MSRVDESRGARAIPVIAKNVFSAIEIALTTSRLMKNKFKKLNSPENDYTRKPYLHQHFVP